MNTKSDCIFCEKQKFPPLLTILLFVAYMGVFALVFCPMFAQKSQNGGTDPAIVKKTIITGTVLIAVGLVVILFILANLQTEIRKDGIYIRFFPFHLKHKAFLFENTGQAYVRRYNPIAEYGGWGIRYGFFGSGKAYNVRGNMGLQIVLKNGKKILIGTQKPDSLDAAVKTVFKPSPQ